MRVIVDARDGDSIGHVVAIDAVVRLARGDNSNLYSTSKVESIMFQMGIIFHLRNFRFKGTGA
ncbi:MAG: hypothetical protein FWD05_06000 [Oscillospiraceae bacterium]|nr:hypothetical protein [Oscillospiraceae bacterium]